MQAYQNGSLGIFTSPKKQAIQQKSVVSKEYSSTATEEPTKNSGSEPWSEMPKLPIFIAGAAVVFWIYMSKR